MLTSYEFVNAWLQARCKTDRGASLVEYALLVALIAVVCIVAVTLLGKERLEQVLEGRFRDPVTPQQNGLRGGPQARPDSVPASSRKGTVMQSPSSEGRNPKRFSGDEGASLVEYALLLALIAVVCIGAVTYFGQNVGKSMSRSGSSILTAESGSVIPDQPTGPIEQPDRSRGVDPRSTPPFASDVGSGPACVRVRGSVSRSGRRPASTPRRHIDRPVLSW